VSTPSTLRVGAVQFLNADPLVAFLAELDPKPEGTPLFSVQQVLPSECADGLSDGRFDLALVPVAAYLQHPEWEVVPECGIGCRGRVQTVIVVSDVPLSEVTRIHLDGASRSSVQLLTVLLRAWGLEPQLSPAAHGEGASRVRGTEAALVIGDAAFGLVDRFAHVTDLGEAWFQLTGLPMVFAFWAARPGVLTEAHVKVLQAARDKGIAKAEELARAHRQRRIDAGKPVLAESDYAAYLRQRIRYRLDGADRAGLVEFLSRAARVPDDADPVHVRFFAREHEGVATARVARATPMRADELLERAAEGGRLTPAEGMFLFDGAELWALGDAADRRRKALHPEGVVTYIVDRNVNYTNVCTARCKFCNFYTPPGGRGAYVLDRDTLRQKFAETEALGGIQILLQGGLNPELGLRWYEDFFRWTKSEFPRLRMHALSPTEIVHIAHLEDMSVRDVLERLRAAGLDSLPGGGAEILHDEIRNRISPFKNTTDEWLDVMRQAHAVGLLSTCTMVFGFQETAEHAIVHMDRLRRVQDEALARPEGGRFTAFIVWPFQAEGTRLKLRDDTSPWRYLRMQALARLYLDNIPNIQVSWPTLGPEIGEVALRFGANDFGSVMIEENVVSQAGAHFMLDAAAIEHHVRQAGFVPQRRTMDYTRLSPGAA
jgi:cyclic dehypoxanthinyl futalosine synthase